MITTANLIEKLQKFIELQILDISKANPMIGFMRPLIIRAASNAVSKADKALSLLADKDGYIDADSILSEMIEGLISTTPFTVNTSFIGDIVIGNGTIKVGIPYTERNLVFNTSDLQNLKEMLITKG